VDRDAMALLLTGGSCSFDGHWRSRSFDGDWHSREYGTEDGKDVAAVHQMLSIVADTPLTATGFIS
jgi:hypothetical protein